MVSVECDHCIIAGCDQYLERPSELVCQNDLVAFSEFLSTGYVRDRYCDYHILSRHSVCLFRHEMNVYYLTRHELCYRAVKTRYHHACSAYELERLAAVIGSVELCAVVESASVVYSDSASYISALEHVHRLSAARAAFASACAAAKTLSVIVIMSVFVVVTLMMMIAVYSCINEFSPEVGLYCSVSVAGCSSAYLDAGISKRVLCSLSHASAYESVDFVLRKQIRERLMAYSVGIHYLGRYYLAVLNIVYLEFLCSSEMLEDIAVIICSSYFHVKYSSVSLISLHIIPQNSDSIMHMNKSERSVKGIIIISVVLLAAAAALSCAARMIPGFAQTYSVTVFPVLQNTLGRAAGLVSFSVSEILCLLLPVLIIIDIIICRHRLRRFMAHLLLLVSVLLFVYTANCGVNYHRDPFIPYEDYESAQFTDDQLADFCEYTVLQLVLNPDRSEYAYPDSAGLAEEAVRSMESLSFVYPQLAGFYPVPKQLRPLSRFFSMMGVSGIYSPFMIEANINGEMEGMEKPFTACHELSHLRGYMDEGQANFIGWLACIGSDDPAFRRSGWLIAWIYAGNALARTNPEAYAELAAELPEEAIEELVANNEFWSTHENKASEIQDKVNDAYLKSNGQKNGIESYGQVTTLMLLWYNGGA